MKKPLKKFPLVDNKNHIYNKLIDNEIFYVDLGWKKFTFELHANLKYNGDGVDGVTHLDTGLIQLEMDLDDDTAKETILHEILHCVLETLGLDERNFPNNTIQVTNEQLTYSLSRGMITVGKLNPGLMELLFK